VSGVFQNVPELLARIRATFDKGSTEHPEDLVQALEACDLLVLDDPGAEQVTPWVVGQVCRLIDARYRHKRPLIVTTNLTLAQLAETFGERAADRLIHACSIVPMYGTSWRQMTQRERCDRWPMR
jgi:DNA replication protein DnaC